MRILSPVYFKELGQMAVSRKPVVMKGILAGVLLLVFAMGMVDAKTMSPSSAGTFGRGLFTAIVFAEMLTMVVLAPVATAGMVCGEREANTLGLLFLTRLRALNIVQDKGLSRITFMLVLCAATVPFMFVAMLFGGIEILQIVAAAGNTLSVIMLSAGVSLFFSTVAKRFSAALADSFAVLVLYYAVVPIVIAFMKVRISASSPEAILAVINPFFSMGFIMSTSMLASRTWLLYSWIGCLVSALAVYVSAVVVASCLLRRVAFGQAAPASILDRTAINKFFRSPFPFHPAVLAHRGECIGGNPVMWKESSLLDDNLKVSLMRITDLLFLAYMGILALAAAVDVDILADCDSHAVAHGLAFAVLLIFTTIVSACCFVREREAGTFSILLTTRLSGKEIVWGTFLGLVRSVVPFAAILLWILLIGRFAVTVGEEGWAPVLGVAMIGIVVVVIVAFFLRMILPRTVCGWTVAMLAFVCSVAMCLSLADQKGEIALGIPVLNILVYFAFFLTVGMYVSLVSSSTGKAIGWALGVLLFVTIGVPLLATFVHEGLDMSAAGSFLLASSPIYWVATGMLPNERFDDEFGGISGYVAVTVFYAGAAVLLLRHMMRSFDRRAGRQSGDADADSAPNAAGC